MKDKKKNKKKIYLDKEDRFYICYEKKIFLFL